MHPLDIVNGCILDNRLSTILCVPVKACDIKGNSNNTGVAIWNIILLIDSIKGLALNSFDECQSKKNSDGQNSSMHAESNHLAYLH